MNVAIVEDDIKSAELLKTCLLKYGTEKDIKFDIVHFTSGEEFIEKYRRAIYSIVFLDIELTGMNGLETARRLRDRDKAVTLIFVTRMAQYAQKGYEVDALDFLIKPLSYADFSLKMGKAVNVARTKEARSVMVTVNGGFTCLSTDKIIFVEVMGHQLKYQLVDGVLEMRGTLSEVEKKLKNNGFLRCNSCYIVNSRFIDSLQGYDLKVAGYTLKISHPRRKQFIKELMDLYKGGG
ncbi:MAG: LytTR family DNA-binding domain-containing protein [Clostridia bacterium]|nr:LytTR family DNA-binding domain-containing protein [Clostridia bacterium]